MHDLTGETPAVSPWLLDEPEISTVVLIRPTPAVTETPEAFAQAMREATGLEVHVQLPDDLPEEVEWLAAISVEGLTASLLCSLERHGAAGTGLLEEHADESGVVIQTILHTGDPLTCHVNVLTLLAMADPHSAGVLDINTGRWIERDALRVHLIESDIDPRDDLLWVVEAEQRDDRWIMSTSGLARCGHRELCIENAPPDRLDAAADLIASVASLVLESALPGDGGLIEIGPELRLQVHGDQDDPEGHVFLLDEHGKDAPVDVLERLEDGVVAIYRSSRASARCAALAASTWEQFLDMQPTLTERGATCFVEVAFERVDGEEDRREHVWMEVTSRDGSAVLAVPSHDTALATGIDPGVCRIEPGEVRSWRVLLDDEAWGPEQLDQLVAHMQRPGT